jgi:hypothetical protein
MMRPTRRVTDGFPGVGWTQDELKRATERPAGKTRVNKSDEKDSQSK